MIIFIFVVAQDALRAEIYRLPELQLPYKVNLKHKPITMLIHIRENVN